MVEEKKEIPMQSRGPNFGVIAAIVVGVLVALAAAVGAFILIEESNDASVDFTRAENGVEEFDGYIRNGIVTVMSALDFDALSQESPLDMIDFAVIQEAVENDYKDLTYLAMGDQITEDMIGQVIHTAGNITLDGDFGEETIIATITADMYSTITEKTVENYEMQNNASFMELLAMSQTNSFETVFDALLGQELYMTGDISVDVEDIVFSGTYEITLLNNQLVLNLDDVEVAGQLATVSTQEQWETIESQTILIDLERLTPIVSELDALIQQNSTTNFELNGEDVSEDQLSMIANLFEGDSFEETPLYTMLNQQLGEALTDAEAGQLILMQDTGNDITGVLIDFVKQTDFFVDIREVDPVREQEGLVCHAGSLDVAGLLENGLRAGNEIVDIIGESDEFTGDTDALEQTQAQIEEAEDSVELALAFVNPTFEIATCYNEETETFAGFGFNIDVGAAGQAIQAQFNTLTVSQDSDFEISQPDFDLDITDLLLESLEAGNETVIEEDGAEPTE